MTSARDRLITVGTELLEAHGHQGVSLRSIAAAAGVSHGAPRRYFPTYQALLAAIARGGLEDLDTTIAPALADDDLRRAARAYLAFARSRPEMFDLITRHDLLEGAGGHLREITGRWFADLGATLARTTGRPPEPAECLALWSAIHGLAALTSRRATEPTGIDPERALDVLLEKHSTPVP
ncbi:TetR/AcrR family transcriptional regulator [Pimelobacter simplex]|uniref:TetR/AcrR family transcriptional regulator n=1 Tax=Nocardioides simplex TaxID=2045 RepID=UPI00214FDBBA|nr:TetR/AcrR family transcriptional regulator [Pimelobacter simplex]UUW91556.1 TetR/AcrR family transcriptional regulator [Pimelobacter simplex]UUW95384.1 TetR/AcrR family transcriptional regulator [Pimelobacter simplex]